ncbi:MAG TPA: hypothetical protein VFQ92_09420 [Blastocatellia bacterium]|nr:hypothetical protein [Blastocatellia bacterium]
MSFIGGYLNGGNSRVFGIFLLSALFITFARVLSPFEIGTDQAVQLEAARRLADGLGLTTTNDAIHGSLDISVAPAPRYLTQWPPAFSILVAGFLLTGLPLLVSLKIIYIVTTLVGWIGWASIASRLVSEPIRIRTTALNVHYLLAAMLPIFTTPLWRGTDIFLWAGVPFFVLLLFKPLQQDRSFMPFIFAGLLFGFLCAMRYASAFLGLAAVFIIFQVGYPRIKLMLKRLFFFSLPSLIVVLPLIAYLKKSPSGASALPAQFTATAGLVGGMYAKAKGILNGAPILSNLILGFPLLEQFLLRINSKPLNFAVGAVCLLIIISLPFIVLKSRASNAPRPQQDLALSLSFLPLSLTLFLIVTRLLTDSALFRIRRYYEPLILCGIFIFYEIAARRSAHRIVKVSSLAIVALFTAYTLIFNTALFFIPERRGQLVQSVLAFTPANSPRQNSTSKDIGYLGWGLYSWKESSRQKVKQLYEAHPDALFFAQEYPLHIYDRIQGGPAPGEKLIDYPGANYLKQAYTSRPIKVFWVMASETQLTFIDESHLKLVHFDPVEDTKIYESDLPAGYKFLGDGR